MERLTIRLKNGAVETRKELTALGISEGFIDGINEIINKLADYEDGEELKEKQEESLQKIFNYYGEDAQERQLIEEMAKLIVALNKIWRMREGILPISAEFIDNFYEELADVSILIEQILIYRNSDIVEEIKQKKIEGQLKRIEGESNVI